MTPGIIVMGVTDRIYAMDDNSALKIVDKEVVVISEGMWKVYN